ncbi:MAG TPA: hypothetical protein VN611_18060 [Patescibacteria group bacterium]|nr:hypothetical protein [Patescibacteria group bacterium]
MKCPKRILQLLVVPLTMLFLCSGPVLAATSPKDPALAPTPPRPATVYPIDMLSPVAQIDWYTGTLNVIGIAAPPSQTISPTVTASPAAMNILTRFAAIEDGRRNLIKAIMAIPVTANATLASLPNPELSLEQATEIATHYKVADEKPLKDSQYQVVLQISLTGKTGAAAVLVNAIKPAKTVEFPDSTILSSFSPAMTDTKVPVNSEPVPVTPVAVKPAKTVAAPTDTTVPPAKAVIDPSIPTGLILELKDASLKRTFCPSIYDENGRLIYGALYITPDNAITYGYVQYLPTPEDIRIAQKILSRVGVNPVTVAASGLRDNDTAIVISTADAEQILAWQSAYHLLDKCPVIIRQPQSGESVASFITPKSAKDKTKDKKKKKPAKQPTDSE